MASLRTSVPYFGLLFLLLAFSEANTEIPVGGKDGAWEVRPSSPESLNHWAETTQFNVGDTLVFKYKGNEDSVLEVTTEDYEHCKTSHPIKAYHDGHTQIRLDRPGPLYFISGVQSHCEHGQKLKVIACSRHPHHRHHHPNMHHPGPVPAPSPSKSPARGRARHSNPVSAHSPVGLQVPAMAPITGDAHGLRVGFVSVAVVLGALLGVIMV